RLKVQKSDRGDLRGGVDRLADSGGSPLVCDGSSGRLVDGGRQTVFGLQLVPCERHIVRVFLADLLEVVDRGRERPDIVLQGTELVKMLAPERDDDLDRRLVIDR